MNQESVVFHYNPRILLNLNLYACIDLLKIENV